MKHSVLSSSNFHSLKKRKFDDKNIPTVQRDSTLPIFSHRDSLIESVQRNPTTIVCGETGSGKSTQLPQFLSQAFATGCVVCTQPRRVAAVTIAERVAAERGCTLGHEVGYSIRFDDKSGPRTRIKYVTDGVLLREIMSDPDLSRYSVVILDEAHERSVQTDILMGLLRRLQERRQELRIVVMSATLEVKLFMDFFKQGSVVQISGRQHPVAIMYTRVPEPDMIEAALLTCLQIHEEEALGGVLVFLPGQEDIENLHSLLQKHLRQMSDAAAVAASPGRIGNNSMSPDEQLKAFEVASTNTRKFILATNIAETSVTISGIKYVVDPGKVKTRCLHPFTGADMLQVVPVSQSQANQRAGRAGRESEGKCFRLFTEEAFDNLEVSTVPEILRIGVSQVLLQLFAMEVVNPLKFPYPTPPSIQALHKALLVLLHLGALGKDKTLTEHGQAMARIPLDPTFAHLLLCSKEYRCTSEALTAVAMLSTDNIYFQPHAEEEKLTASRIHRQFTSKDGDFISLIKIFNDWIKAGRSKMWSTRSYLNHRALLHAESIRQQITEILKENIFAMDPSCSCGTARDPILKCIAKGLSANIAASTRSVETNSSGGKKLQHKMQALPAGQAPYRTISGGQDVHIHPTSSLFSTTPSKLPKYVVYAEILVTTKHYMRYVSVMDIDWLPELNLQHVRAVSSHDATFNSS